MSEKFSNGTKFPKQTKHGLKYIILCKLCETYLARVRKKLFRYAFDSERFRLAVELSLPVFTNKIWDSNAQPSAGGANALTHCATAVVHYVFVI